MLNDKQEDRLLKFCISNVNINKEVNRLLSSSMNSFSMSHDQMASELVSFYIKIHEEKEISLSSSNMTKYRKGFLLRADEAL